MNELSMTEIDTLAQTAKLSGFLPYLEQALDKMEAMLDRKVFALLDKDELTPQLAVYAWQEKRIIQRLYSQFHQKIATAQSIGEQYQRSMNDAK